MDSFKVKSLGLLLHYNGRVEELQQRQYAPQSLKHWLLSSPLQKKFAQPKLGSSHSCGPFKTPGSFYLAVLLFLTHPCFSYWLQGRVKEGKQFFWACEEEIAPSLLLTWIPLVNLLKYHTHNESKEGGFGAGVVSQKFDTAWSTENNEIFKIFWVPEAH